MSATTSMFLAYFQLAVTFLLILLFFYIVFRGGRRTLDTNPMLSVLVFVFLFPVWFIWAIVELFK